LTSPRKLGAGDTVNAVILGERKMVRENPRYFLRLAERTCRRRVAAVEPVFGNLRHKKRLNRFTLRGQKKVDGQWKLFCLVHNIEKLAHHGYGQ